MSDLPASLTRDLARRVCALRRIPARAAELARMGVIDTIGLMLAARDEPVVQAVRRTVAPHSPETGQGASVLFRTERMRASDAAFVNATAAHAFAMDDVAWGCHPSAMLFPALLAVGETHGASGADLLRAWVAGYEVLAELASREPDSLHPTGWHPSGLLGPLAVAGAVCTLRGLDLDQTTHALGLAAGMGGGMSVNFGTQAKAVGLGRVALSGVLAAELAAQGVDAARDALERPTGFLRTISPNKRADIATPLRGDDAALHLLEAGLGIKKYPLCYSVHRIADAAIDLSRQPGMDPARVERITVEIGRRQAAMARYVQPSSALEARYSVPFAVVSGLLSSAAGFAQLVPAFYESDPVRRLIARTEVRLRDDASADDPVFSASDRVRVQLAGGRVFDSGEVAYARGHARLPIDAAQLSAKFIDCAASGGVVDAQALHAWLQDFDAIARVSDIARKLEPSPFNPPAAPSPDS